MRRIRHGSRRLTSALLVLAVVVGLCVPLPALAATHGAAPAAIGPRANGSISGTATIAGTGLPAANVSIEVYTPDGSLVDDTVVTGANGKFTQTVAPGQYKILFTDYYSFYEDQYYDGVDNWGAAAIITVGDGEAKTDVDASLTELSSGGGTYGSVAGTVTAGNTGLPIEGVQVSLLDPVDKSEWAQEITGADGSYSIMSDTGDYIVKFVDPSGAYATQFYNGKTTIDAADKVTIADGTTVQGVSAVLAYDPADILVTPAGYDDFGAILDRMGWGYRVVDLDEFAQPAFDASPYKAFFVNCSGEANGPSAAAVDKIRSFVEAGGALYASDWAASVVASGFPGKVLFDAYAGQTGTVRATVKDAGLSWYMNPANPASEVDLNYDLGGWYVPTGLGTGVTELLRGTPPEDTVSRPLAATFKSGKGRVLYTSFHNEAQLTDLQAKLLQYFALIPYTQEFVSAIDALKASKYPGYAEVASWLGAISQGQSSTPYSFKPGINGSVIILDWNGATLKVQIKRPDGTVFAEGTSDGSSPLEFVIPAGTGTSPSTLGISAAGDWSIVVNGVTVANANTPYALKLFSTGTGGAPGNPALLEVAGPTRIDTAIKASQEAFDSADTVVIATAYNFPDALGGSSLAGAVDAPLLLTAKDALPAAVEAEVRRLGAKKAYILGSDAAVGKPVADKLATLVGGASNVERLGGADRYATAALIAKETVEIIDAANFDGTVFIATGENFPDALAASPIAAAKKRPILLTRGAALPPVTADALTTLKVKKAVLLGSAKAVTDTVKSAITAKSIAASRLEGPTRYQTAIAVAESGVTEGLTWDGLAIATGTNYPDALSGGVMCGKLGSVMLLTDPGTLTPDVKTKLTANKATIGTVRFLGSTAAVTAGVRTAVGNALK